MNRILEGLLIRGFFIGNTIYLRRIINAYNISKNVKIDNSCRKEEIN
jgi:hypothetical protein